MNEYFTIQKTDAYGRPWYLQKVYPAKWTKIKEEAHKFAEHSASVAIRQLLMRKQSFEVIYRSMFELTGENF